MLGVRVDSESYFGTCWDLIVLAVVEVVEVSIDYVKVSNVISQDTHEQSIDISASYCNCEFFTRSVNPFELSLFAQIDLALRNLVKFCGPFGTILLNVLTEEIVYLLQFCLGSVTRLRGWVLWARWGRPAAAGG